MTRFWALAFCLLCCLLLSKAAFAGTLYSASTGYDSCCATGPYDSTTHTCCAGLIIEGARACCAGRPIDTETTTCCADSIYPGKDRHCCGGSTYDPKTQVCCNDGSDDSGINHYRVYDKSSGKKCCGPDYYSPKKEICLGDQGGVIKKPHKNQQVCGNTTYSPNKFFCCERNPDTPHVVPYLDIPKDSATCCGSKPYNYRNPTACCGATIYDTRTHACCGDQQLFEFTSQSCCNGALFDPKSFTCCSNDMLAPSGGCCTSYPELCCGGKQFDPEYQMCVDGSVSPLTCGPQATPVSIIQTCCGDSVYETDERKYCCGNHYLLETSEGVGCCNGAPYNRASHGCCGDKGVYDLSEFVCC